MISNLFHLLIIKTTKKEKHNESRKNLINYCFISRYCWCIYPNTLCNIVSGATNPLNEISDRTGYLIFAGVGPMVAGQLDAIPFIGSYVGAIIVSITLFAAGIWLSSIILSLVKRVMP